VQHDTNPSLRYLQKNLAQEITIRVHSLQEYEAAVDATEILFGKATTDALKNLSEELFLQVFDGVPQSEIAATEILDGNKYRIVTK
jgi:tyrosyl-tRNA synthetase